jgi:predicted GH43/DUF377 family glycosyl hydrolase
MTTNIKIEELVIKRHLLIEANSSCPWASEMVLNPGLIYDSKRKKLHMLFRATGPFEASGISGKPSPFPIFLGYSWSDDLGETWSVDWSKPALSPLMKYESEEIKITSENGSIQTNYSNGCIEDPRIFFLEGECYLIAACRMFPPGPYWLHDEPTQCAPDWVKTDKNKIGKAASENYTTNVLYKVNLDALSDQKYDQSFTYVTHLTNPELGENRDVILFPQKLQIDNKQQYVCLHRPWDVKQYKLSDQEIPPSIAICSAERLEDFSSLTIKHHLYATPRFDWERDRIGASGPLLEIESGKWLLSYHGKQSPQKGYFQSFMILSYDKNKQQLPVIENRCAQPILYPVEPWEMPDKFKSPVVFITGMVEVQGKLLVSYGAADQKVGIAWLDLEKLLSLVRSYDHNGNLL